MLRFFDFFFQAEDGIRDIGVTGVQTCALPIYSAFQMVHLQSRITIRFQNVEKFEVIMIKCFPLKLW